VRSLRYAVERARAARALAEQARLLALRETDEQRRIALQAADMGTWTVDPDSALTTVDERCASFFGLQGAGTRPLADIIAQIHGADRERVRQEIGHSMNPASDGGYDIEYRTAPAQGPVRWLRAKGQAVFAGSGSERRARTFFGVVQDVTERRDVLDALARSEEQYRVLADSMPQLVWATDKDGNHTFFNRRWYEYTGLSVEDSLGFGFAKALHPNDVERTLLRWRRSWQDGEPYEIEYRFRSADGEYRWFVGRAEAIRGEDGKVSGWVGTCTDIHAQKLAEAEVLHLNDVLESRVEERTRELQQRNEEQEAFIFTASHDLRQPLLSLQGMATMLEEAVDSLPGTAEVTYVTERIRANVSRLSALLDDLLALSRVGRLNAEAQAVPLGETVASVLHDLGSLSVSRGVTIEQSPSWPTLWCSPTEAQQVLSNLLENACKYGRREGVPARIRISWEPDGEFVRLRVSDNGPGVPLHYREKVFDLFRKLDAGTGGTGVGLAIVKRIAQRNGGRAWVEESDLGGASFVVTLPSQRGSDKPHLLH
jgi:PAS domain S-box-containing protein